MILQKPVTAVYRAAFVACCCAVSVYCQYLDWFTDFRGRNAGHTVCNFLTLPVSAADLGRGMAGSWGQMNAVDVSLFPANAALFNSPRFSITHLEWLMGLRKEYTAAAFPVGGAGTVGMYGQVFTPGRFEGARDIDEMPVDVNIVEFSGGVSWSRAFLKDAVAAGLTVSYLESHLEEAAARGAAVTADLLVRPFEAADFRVFVRNAGPDVTYTATKEPLPVEAGVSGRFRPFVRKVAWVDKVDLNLGVGALKAADQPVVAGAAAEATIIRQIFARAGYEYRYGSEPGAWGLSLGLGVGIGPYAIDFGWKNLSQELGSVWAASAHYHRDEIEPKTAKDYYEAAEKEFRRANWRRCIYFAKKAARLDPNMWQAHTIISRAIAELRRREGSEIALIYTGNVRSRFVAPDGGLGGLARQAALVAALKTQFPVCFTLDAGNMLAGTDHALKADVSDGYYRHLGYDAVGLGEGELAFGLDRFMERGGAQTRQYICTNMPELPHRNIVSSRIVERGRYRIAFLDVIGPQTAAAAGVPGVGTPIAAAVRAHLENPNIKNCNVRVLVIHDTWERVKSAAELLPEVDIMVCGSLSQRFETSMRAGRVHILSAGDGGRYVGLCVMRFNDERRLVTVENRLYPVSGQTQPDAHIDSLVARTTMKIEGRRQEELADAVRDTVDGVFAFVSDRDGRRSVYLKVVDRLAEFPLAAGGADCDAPAVSFAAGRIAYTETIEESAPALRIMDLTGGRKQAVMPGAAASAPSFSFDGRWLFFSVKSADGTTDLVRMPADSGAVEPVAVSEGFSESGATFSPDSVSMAFVSDRDGGKKQVYLTNVNGEQPVRITDIAANHFAPAFSPDGRFVAWLSDWTGFGGLADLWLYDRDKGETRQITRNAKITEFCWLPDSRTIVYSAGVNLRDFNTIDVVSLASAKLIVASGPKTWNETSPQVIRYRGAPRLLYVRDYEEERKEVWWVNLDGSGDEKAVTAKGNAWLR